MNFVSCLRLFNDSNSKPMYHITGIRKRQTPFPVPGHHPQMANPLLNHKVNNALPKTPPLPPPAGPKHEATQVAPEKGHASAHDNSTAASNVDEPMKVTPDPARHETPEKTDGSATDDAVGLDEPAAAVDPEKKSSAAPEDGPTDQNEPMDCEQSAPVTNSTPQVGANEHLVEDVGAHPGETETRSSSRTPTPLPSSDSPPVATNGSISGDMDTADKSPTTDCGKLSETVENNRVPCRKPPAENGGSESKDGVIVMVNGSGSCSDDEGRADALVGGERHSPASDELCAKDANPVIDTKPVTQQKLLEARLNSSRADDDARSDPEPSRLLCNGTTDDVTSPDGGDSEPE